MVERPGALPWQDLMEFGLGELALAPPQFWAMSLPELNAALRGKRQCSGRSQNHAPNNDELAQLMRAFPDATRDQADGN